MGRKFRRWQGGWKVPKVLPVRVTQNYPVLGAGSELRDYTARGHLSNVLKPFRFYVFLNTMCAERNTSEGQVQAPGNPAFIFS